MHISPIRLKIVPFAVAAMLGGLATGAYAAPQIYGNITLDAVYSLGGGPVTDGMNDVSGSVSSNANGADFYLFKSGAPANNVFFHTYGFTGGSTYFGARASGEGQFFGDTRATLSQVFTNTSGVAQTYNFGFMVDQGEIALFGAGAGYSNLLLSVKKNGVTVAQDLTRVEQDLLGNVTCSDNDFGLTNASGTYMSCGGGNFNNAYGFGGLFNVSMGVIGAGESFTLDYDIVATVSGDLSAGSSVYYQACNNGYGDEGYPQLQAAIEGPGDPDAQVCSFQQFFPGSAIARSGDPFNGPQFGGSGPSAQNFASFNVTNVPATVPEPGSIALMGLALAGLAASRRKKPHSAT